MTEVPLTQGQVALIDDEDADRVLAHKWHARWSARCRRWYALRTPCGPRPRRTVLLHRFIIDAPPDVEVDHVNMNGLDNRRSNLRLATPSQNGRNRERQINNKSGFKGVSWDRKKKRFRAQIELRGVKRHVGYFKSAIEAARAYDAAARLLHGEFARLNFPPD